MKKVLTPNVIKVGEWDETYLAAALLRRLGDFPFWRGEKTLLEGLTPSYAEASQMGLDLYLFDR